MGALRYALTHDAYLRIGDGRADNYFKPNVQ